MTIPERIYAFHERKAADWHRPHLGASIIGTECERAIWYSFRWATKPETSGRILRLFETGHLAENRLFIELKNIGIPIHDQQKHVDIFPHFSGAIDSLGEFPGLSLVEVKTHNQKSFDDLTKKGVKESKPEHFDQMTIYMHALKLPDAHYFAINKNTDEIYCERVEYDAANAGCLIAKARRIIDATEPPARLNESPAFYKCKMCDHASLCFGAKLPEVNCRTCAHATPNTSGGWHCKTWGVTTSGDCPGHLFFPSMIGETPVDAGDDWIKYETWTNGPEHTRSKDYSK